jgi:uncharacterized protein
MQVFWDESKRQSNLAKHGLDFADVLEHFDLASATVRPTRNGRFRAVGPFKETVVVMIFSMLGTEAMSVISLRKASKRERKAQ